MNRFVLSLVTALSLMGAAQAFAIPVPVVERLNFRTATTDSSYATFGGSTTTKYSQAIPTAKLCDPFAGFPGIHDGSAASSADSAAWAIFRIVPKTGSAVTVAADTLFFHIQVSANGTDWLTWTPPSALAPTLVTSTSLGTSKALALVEHNSLNTFYHALRLDAGTQGYPFFSASPGINAAGVTDAKGWNMFPLIRVALEARASAGQYELFVRYYSEKPGTAELVDKPLWFRHNSTAFLQNYTDSAYASSNGATGAAFAGAALDTTAAVSFDEIMLPKTGGYMAGATDTLGYASLLVTTTTRDGNTPGNFDSVYVSTQISFNGSDWTTVSATRSVVEAAGADAAIMVIKQTNLGQVGLAWPNGGLVPIFSGGTVTMYRMYGLAPLVRFIIRRDVDCTGALIASLRYFKYREW